MIKPIGDCGKIAVKTNKPLTISNQADVITRLFGFEKLVVSCLGCKGSLVQIQSRRPFSCTNSSKQFKCLHVSLEDSCGIFSIPMSAVNGESMRQWETAIAVNCGTEFPIDLFSYSSDQYSKTLNRFSNHSKSSLRVQSAASIGAEVRAGIEDTPEKHLMACNSLIPGSSNGRTSSFGLENGGSIPSPGTISQNKAHARKGVSPSISHRVSTWHSQAVPRKCNQVKSQGVTVECKSKS